MHLTISAPDHTTISRLAVTSQVVQLASVPHGPLHLLVDSTGLRGESMAGSKTLREIEPQMVQTASGGRCR
jgi:hypothetical protein